MLDGRRVFTMLLTSLSVASAALPMAPAIIGSPLCEQAASDGRWIQRPMDTCQCNNGTLVRDDTLPRQPPQAVEDWQWTAETTELCRTHHYTTEYVPSTCMSRMQHPRSAPGDPTGFG